MFPSQSPTSDHNLHTGFCPTLSYIFEVMQLYLDTIETCPTGVNNALHVMLQDSLLLTYFYSMRKVTCKIILKSESDDTRKIEKGTLGRNTNSNQEHHYFIFAQLFQHNFYLMELLTYDKTIVNFDNHFAIG